MEKQSQSEWLQQVLSEYIIMTRDGVTTQGEQSSDEVLTQEQEDSKPPAAQRSSSPNENSSSCTNRFSPCDSDEISQNTGSSLSLDENTLQSLEEAIMLLPPEETQHYFKVKKERPELIEKESNPLWYLKSEQFNTWKAAKKLAYYWHQRFHLFGERATLPMNQTGEGALNKKDLLLLKTGFIAFAPPDKDGRTIIINDASKRSRKKKELDSITRVYFYIHHIAMQNPATIRKGFVVILLLSKAVLDIGGRHMSERTEMAVNAFAFHNHSLHLVGRNDTPMQSVLDEAIPFLFSAFPRNKSRKFFHKRSMGNERLLKILEEEHGIYRRSVPTSLGGDLTDDKFDLWRERRIRIEWELPLGVLGSKEDDGAGVKRFSELTEAERKERKRRYGILHSRRKRKRDKMEQQVLEDQIQHLNEEKSKQNEESRRLRKLLQDAHKQIAFHSERNMEKSRKELHQYSSAVPAMSTRQGMLASPNMVMSPQDTVTWYNHQTPASVGAGPVWNTVVPSTLPAQHSIDWRANQSRIVQSRGTIASDPMLLLLAQQQQQIQNLEAKLAACGQSKKDTSLDVKKRRRNDDLFDPFV